MLPDKNELNDELIERINDGLEDDSHGKILAECLFICPNCGKRNDAYKKLVDGFCPYCKPELLKTVIPAGDIKTTVLIPSNKKKIIPTYKGQ